MITNTALNLIFSEGVNPIALADYEPNVNAYVDILNKIGRQIIRGVIGFNNPYARFKFKFDNGDTVETSFVECVSGVAFSLTNNNPFRISNPTVLTEYHTLTTHLQYLKTLRDLELQKALLPSNSFGDFVASVMAAIKYGANLDEYNANKLFSFPVASVSTDIALLGEFDFYGKQVIYPSETY